MEVNEALHKEILSVVDNQINQNDPPETKITFERLVKSGISKTDAKKYIGQCVILEMFSVIKEGKEFDENRYINNLKKLPESPFDEDEME